MSNCDDILEPRIRLAAKDDKPDRITFHGLNLKTEKAEKAYAHAADAEVGDESETLVVHGLSNLPGETTRAQVGRAVPWSPACNPDTSDRLAFEDLVYNNPCDPDCFDWEEPCGDPIEAASRRKDKIVADKIRIVVENYGERNENNLPYDCCANAIVGKDYVLKACTTEGEEIPDHREVPNPIPEGPGQYPCFDCSVSGLALSAIAQWMGKTSVSNDNGDDECYTDITLDIRWVVQVLCYHDSSTDPWTCRYRVQVDMFHTPTNRGEFLDGYNECCFSGNEGIPYSIRYYRGCADFDSAKQLCGAFADGIEVEMSSLENHGPINACENCGFDILVKFESSRDLPPCEECFDFPDGTCAGSNAVNPNTDFVVANTLKLLVSDKSGDCNHIIDGADIYPEACPTASPFGCEEPDGVCFTCPNPPANADADLIAVWYAQPLGFGLGDDAAVLSATVKIFCWKHEDTDITCYSMQVDVCVDAVVAGGGCCVRCGHYRGCVDTVAYSSACGYITDPITVSLYCMESGDDCEACEMEVTISTETHT